MSNIKIGVIGGTGIKAMDMFNAEEIKTVKTPFGNPSSNLFCGRLNGVQCVIVSRHGNKHEVMPSEINYRANIMALKEEGCKLIIATTACGSLKEEIVPGHIVVLDQFIDRTQQRKSTFYDGTVDEFKGICHIPMRSPFCPKLRNILIESCKQNKVNFHSSGTAVTIQGPRFSTLAESNLYRSWDASVVNMTTVPEVVLANEVGILYASLALVTDYDCWKDNYESVNSESVLKVMIKTGETAAQVIATTVKLAAQIEWSEETDEMSKQVNQAIVL